ncbi:uncharacterized protein LOC18014268 [Eutrema salsugineum]|uniref:uncharacterized protein LOC18014268 n=1 Tax=Eutrema salsugineum TaxID=72664 RepID=UPI000CECFB77|nr:uncharacterized protein LOC18014268 [Eutrema salsugineum]
MDQQTQRVKIPCNHMLRYIDLEFAVDPQHWIYRSPSHNCDGCGIASGYGYYCSRCQFGAHAECIDGLDIITHPSHSKHPLKNVLTKTVDYTDSRCHFCRRVLGERMYHCSTCNFSIDMDCWIIQPPLTIYQPKSHNHTFTLMPVRNSFTCNGCGIVDCIDLPRVININRHEHRISRTYHLGHGDWQCGVCRKKMDWTCGAFSCKKCPSYAVHSKCAIRNDVWDEKELEDEPEEKEIRYTYQVINEKEIKHCSHRHNLRLRDDNAAEYEEMLCEACIAPISSDPFFKCVQCEFFLHKVCAILSYKKRHILHKHRLSLETGSSFMAREYFKCTYCRQFFDGFMHYCESFCNLELDLRCANISEPFHHELHPHPLYRTSTEPKTCGGCGKDSEYVLCCIVCEFALGMECATLPRKVKHRCDDHVLSLHHGAGNSKGQLWCDICEGKTDPSVWFYGCDECGVTLHIKCVLGDMYYFKAGRKYRRGELVPNDGMTRPFCTVCKMRCMFPFFLKSIASDSTVVYACSMECTENSWYFRWL